MKRFIQHTELARDRRFNREDTSFGTIMSKLPDDAEALVRLVEQFEPMIAASVQGTEAQPLYEEYGPGFGVVINNSALDPADPVAPLRLKMRMHGIFMGELQALEGAARSLWDFPEAPWEFKMNMARQSWDEARHVQIYEKLLGHVGGYVGMFPENTFLFEVCCHEDPAMRVAAVNRGLEGLACDVFRDMIRYAEKTGDQKMRQAIDYVLADELTHVRFGSEWVKEFTRNDPARFKAAQEYRKDVDRRFNFGGARSDAEDASIPLAWEDRLEAGFSEEELREILTLEGGGPSVETTRKAGAMLLERYRARRAAQSSAA